MENEKIVAVETRSGMIHGAYLSVNGVPYYYLCGQKFYMGSGLWGQTDLPITCKKCAKKLNQKEVVK